MKEEDKKRLRHLLWFNKAEKHREAQMGRLQDACPGFDGQFVGSDESDALGELFWTKVRSLKEMRIPGFGECEKFLRPELWPDTQVAFIHDAYDECGAILCNVRVLVEHAVALQSITGPDFFFVAPRGDFGFCYEEDDEEDDASVRVWGRGWDLR